MESEPGSFEPGELDWQIDAAEAAGKQIIVCLGPVKTFGYPEYFVAAHHLKEPLPEGHLVEPATLGGGHHPSQPPGRGMYSCLPEHVIDNYNQTMCWHRDGFSDAWAYLFWGAEYWLLRRQHGDHRYLDAFTRVLEES